MTSCLSSIEIQRLIGPMACRFPEAEADLPIVEVVTEILSCAQSFVPCEAGSLMLSHPEQQGALVFVASFGEGASKIPGTVLPPGKGIAGQVYLTGQPFMTNSPDSDINFYGGIDQRTGAQTSSLLSVPLRAFGQSVGVLNLLNRKGGGFETRDLNLLNIFCDHLTQSIRLVLEARKQREAAFKDHLTGLSNDRHLFVYLTSAIRTALERREDLGLVFLDLDHFKSVVDTHGHLVGSQALREIGYLIKKVSDRYSGVAARYGGDEYVVVLPSATDTAIAELAESLRLIIEKAEIHCEGEDGSNPVIVAGKVTASIGTVCLCKLETEGKTPESVRQQMLRVADDAMYEAKAQGKNRVFHFS